MAPAWKQQTGWTFLNNDAEYPHYFSHHILNFKPDQQIDWNIVAKQIEVHHSILVVDPYIFGQNGLIGLCKLLKKIAPQKLDKTYQITLIGKPDGKNDQLERNVKNKLNEVLNTSYNLELFSINKEAFHDRYLFTNNVMIFSGYGFDLTNTKDQIKKDTTWHIYQPFQRIDNKEFGYQIMQQKLSLFHKWIDNKSQNRLFKIL